MSTAALGGGEDFMLSAQSWWFYKYHKKIKKQLPVVLCIISTRAADAICGRPVQLDAICCVCCSGHAPADLWLVVWWPSRGSTNRMSVLTPAPKIEENGPSHLNNWIISEWIKVNIFKENWTQWVNLRLCFLIRLKCLWICLNLIF